MNDDMSEKPAAMVLTDAAMDVIHDLRRQGITTAAGIARALNERGITTLRGAGGRYRSSTAWAECAATRRK